MDLGQQIRVARKRRNMTQAYLAQRLGVQPMVIDRWEGAICNPAPAQLKELGEILATPLSLSNRVDANRGMASTPQRFWLKRVMAWYRQRHAVSK
ncbi:helix-turn-helix transcriptional regulator [Levilactobacillus zymae]|uniref:helix-turn-helix domain-containing protein n=1 Tax=Levilactobacillus zymae TaxID=267363 RepID=UPI0028B6C499|nr:helix-turn-helix transcriptional regulator [Levilactobacillus zymae]MDT6979238.1 helix-turn-helix transcriptional regulator [Levilactobacillus zymae]